jgi:5-methyltetrahydrofolate--homocysteine methyltransferase
VQYFNGGRIGEDQVADWAEREGVTVPDTRRALAPQL